MGSPFPGMDPYLEGEMWQEFHQTLANALRTQLQPKLKPKYVALLARRFVLENVELGVIGTAGRTVYPDVHVSEYGFREDGGVLVAPPKVELDSPMLEEAPQLSIEIRDVAQRRLVTLIEILSPANKLGKGAAE